MALIPGHGHDVKSLHKAGIIAHRHQTKAVLLSLTREWHKIYYIINTGCFTFPLNVVLKSEQFLIMILILFNDSLIQFPVNFDDELSAASHHRIDIYFRTVHINCEY